MEKWKRDRTRTAWSFAWVYALLFHQLLIPFLQGGDFVASSFLVTTIYFGVITFLFTFAFFLMPAWVVAVLLFVFGAFMELFVFNVIIDPILAGLFYVGMFFIPRWISRKMYSGPKDADIDEEDAAE